MNDGIRRGTSALLRRQFQRDHRRHRKGLHIQVMKTLFLIRHAKSSWDDTALPDKDRPLGDRGSSTQPGITKLLTCSK